jgi:hypothetical protein
MANSLNSISPEDERVAVENLINMGGLKYIFAIMMRQGVRGEDVDEQKTIDENCLYIIYSMIKNTT